MDRLRNNDLPLIIDVKQRLVSYPAAAEHLHTITYDLNTDNIAGLIQKCHFVITSRFHAMVAALGAGIPVAVVGWGHKYTEVMASFGLEGFVLDFGEFNGTALNPIIQASLSNTPMFKKRIKSGLNTVKSSSREQFDYLFKFLGQN
jgi:polysaccharide pyruvyl transferase WcaK-like protein